MSILGRGNEEAKMVTSLDLTREEREILERVMGSLRESGLPLSAEDLLAVLLDAAAALPPESLQRLVLHGAERLSCDAASPRANDNHTSGPAGEVLS